jgi:small subunit ribosomal protein S17
VTTAKFKAHDAENTCKIGDRVRIRECRPLSREKRWLVVETTGRDNMTNVDKDSNA